MFSVSQSTDAHLLSLGHAIASTIDTAVANKFRILETNINNRFNIIERQINKMTKSIETLSTSLLCNLRFPCLRDTGASCLYGGCNQPVPEVFQARFGKITNSLNIFDGP